MEYICNCLMVVGSKAMVRRFARSYWDKVLRAKHCNVAENSPGRFIIQFNTDDAPISEPLRALSQRWPKLVLMLDWEWEDQRLKGFVHAKAGLLDSYQTEY